MKNKLNIVIYVLVALIVIVLLWALLPGLKEKVEEKELIFNIKEEKIEVKVGTVAKIEYEISEEANIVWETSDNSIATVNSGMVTGKSLGTVTIRGTVIKDNQKVVKSCKVITYKGEKNITLSDIEVPEGEIFITKGDSYEIPITYKPEEGYITRIDYNVVDSKIAEYDKTLIAKNIGTTEIMITINNTITKTIKVNVIEKKIEPTFSKKITDVKVKEENITLKPNDTKEIEYSVEPEGSLIESIKWESSNEKIATVEDGVIKAITSGEATIVLTINGTITKTIRVKVDIPVTGLNISSNPKIVMKVGQKETIKASIVPSNATDSKIIYTSSNNSVSVDSNGVVTGVSKGTGTITVKTEDGKYQGSVSYTVNAKTGLISGTGGIWGYSSPLDKVPVRADKSFFQNLASNGKGTISGNIYTYKDSKRTYTYDLSTNILKSDNVTSLMRIYYPQGVDLSSVNTYAFYGGDGEKNFKGYFSDIDNNRSIIKSSGIIILVSTYNSYGPRSAEYATEFLKAIINQKSGVHNAVGGYSASGTAAGEAAGTSTFDRLILFNTKFSARDNLKNKEIYIYSAISDDLTSQTIYSINSLTSKSYSNVTIISNNGAIANNSKYQSEFLVINPGNTSTWAHHSPRNITNAGVFSFACR